MKNISNLYKRTYANTIGNLVYMWALLFIPAWSLNFWQGWTFWGIFSASMIIITMYFLKKNPTFMESRLKVGPLAEKEKSQKIIQTFSTISFILLLIISGLDFRFHWSTIPTILVLVGDVCAVIGFWMIFLVFKENSFASGTIEIGKNQKVISTGPYRLIRHPMYAGAGVLVALMPLALGSYWAIFPVLSMGVLIVLRLLHEEKYLLRHLSGYADYCKKVRFHLIPFVW